MTDQRVGIYIRLSLADGDGKAESDSISNQRELIHQFLDRHPQLKTAPREGFIPPGEVSAAAHGHGAVKTAPYKPLVIVAS